MRSPIAPYLPTVTESSLPGYDVEVWYGLLAPKGVPTPVVQRLNAELKAILALPDVRERLANLGADTLSSTPEKFAMCIRGDMVKWGRVIKVSGAQPG